MIHNLTMRTTPAQPAPLPTSAHTTAVPQRAFLLPIFGPSMLVLGLGACAEPAEKVALAEPSSEDGGHAEEEGGRRRAMTEPTGRKGKTAPMRPVTVERMAAGRREVTEGAGKRAIPGRRPIRSPRQNVLLGNYLMMV